MGISRHHTLCLAWVLVCGCSYVGVGSSPDLTALPTPSGADETAKASNPPESAKQTPDATGSPAFRPSPTPTVTASSAVSPTPLRPDLAESDTFWNRWYEPCFFGPITPIPASLKELISRSDVVVRGSIRDLRVRQFGDWEVVLAKVEVAEVLLGTPHLSRSGTVDIQLFVDAVAPDVTSLRSRIPGHDHLWFVTLDQGFAGTYYPSSFAQISILRDIGGMVEVIQPERISTAYSADQFPVPLDGTDFDELVQKVRELTDAAGSTRIFAKKATSKDSSVSLWAAC